MESSSANDNVNEVERKKGLLEIIGWPKTVVILTIANGPVNGINTAHSFVKILYMTEELGMTKRQALLLAHGSQGLKVIGGVLAGIIADSFTGKYLVLASSYAAQSFVALWYGASLLTVKWLYIVALLFENLAMFGQPLLLIFLPEQFDESSQDKKLQGYYTYDYIYLNFSAIFWALILIEIVNEYNCLSGSKCYSVIFFPYALCVIIYASIFISMKKLYKIHLPSRTVIRDVIACMFTSKKNAPENEPSTVERWADKRCDQDFKKDVIQVRRVALITSLSFLFYLVLYQTETTFIYQASFLDGSFGEKWILKPSHAEIINPVAVITFAPLLQHFIFPQLDKWGILNTPLKKIGTSYLLACAGFLMAGILQSFVDSKSVGDVNEGEAQLRFYNAMTGLILISGKATGNLTVPGLSSVVKNLAAKKKIRHFKIRISSESGEPKWKGRIDAVQSRSTGYIFRENELIRVTDGLRIEKSKSLRPTVVVYCGDITCQGTIAFKSSKNQEASKRISIPVNSSVSSTIEMPYVGWFQLLINDTVGERFEFRDGGMYSLLLTTKSFKSTVSKFTLHSPNSIHIFWIFPQMITMALAEIFQYIPSNLFVFTQSPPCLRSVVRVIQSSFISLAHLTIASLNMIQMDDLVWFFSLSVLVLVAAVFHVILSLKYEYVASHAE